MNNDPIRRVVIVGGGIAGWMTAAALSEQFKGLLEIELIELGRAREVDFGETTIPQFGRYMDLLGIEDDAFLRRTKGTFRLGTVFNDWGRLGDTYIHAFGSIGMKLNDLDFHHYWLKAFAGGQADSLDRYSLDAAAALANRFDRLENIPDTHLAGLVHGYHFDAGLFAAFLREYSERRGVRRQQGKVVDVGLLPENGFIHSVKLEDGRQVAGDLYIDCTGFRGMLIEEALETGYEDWSLWLPCDRVVVVPTQPSGPLLPYTTARAMKAGWQWRVPLQHRVSNGHVYSSRYMDDEEARAALMENLDGEPLAEPRLQRFQNGMRKRLWNRNCVALGRSACFLEPLESTNLHLIQDNIGLLLEYFPRKGFDQVDIDEFNRRCTWEFERIRDFLILHYHANERRDSRFWSDRHDLPVPAELHRRIDLFRTNGRIHGDCDELFTAVAWLQVLVGQNVMPTGWHPLADRIDEAQMGRFLTSIQTIINSTVEKMPEHGDFVARNCAAG